MSRSVMQPMPVVRPTRAVGAVRLMIPICGLALMAAEPPAAGPVTYEKDVRPILRKHCTICHNSETVHDQDQSGGLDLSSYRAVLRGAGHPVIVPGQAAKSPLVARLTIADEDRRMPLGMDPLPAAKIAVIRRWVESGGMAGVAPRNTPAGSVPGPARAGRPRRPPRRLDVVFKLAALPPAHSLPPVSTTGPLSLSLKIGPLPPVAAVRFSPDGRVLAAGSYGQTVIWDTAAAKVVAVIPMDGMVQALAFSPDGRTLAAAGGQPAQAGLVQLDAVGAWIPVRTLSGHRDVVTCVAFNPAATQLASASFDRTIRIWDLKTGRTIRTLDGHSDFVYQVAFSPDGKKLISSSKDRSIKVFDAARGTSERTFSGHQEDVLALAVSPDGKQIVSAGIEPALRWWRFTDDNPIRTMSGHGGPVNQLTFSRDGKLLASAGSDGRVVIWDGSSGAPVKTLTGANEWLYCVALSPNAKTVAAGSWDGVVRVWDLASGNLRLTLCAPPSATPRVPDWLAITPEGYYGISPGLASLARWHVGNQAVAAKLLDKPLHHPDRVARALQGGAVPAVNFAAK